MSFARVRAEHSPWVELRRGLTRERALIALFDRSQQKGLARGARGIAVGIFVGYAAAILFARGADRRSLIQGYLQAALGALSWLVGGLAALGATRTLAQPASPSSDALTALAIGRGYPRSVLLRARTLSIAVRVARWVAMPGVLLVVLGLARGTAPLWALAEAPAVIVYASALGVVVALLALFSARLSARRPRWVLLGLVLGPELIAQAFPGFPSPVALMSTLLEQLLHNGMSYT